MGGEGKVYSLAEVSQHNNAKDCWLVIEGKDVGHSSSARAMMDEFNVGDIDTPTVPTKTKYTPPKQPHYDQDKTSEFFIKLLQFLVPLLILGLAFGVHFYTKSSA